MNVAPTASGCSCAAFFDGGLRGSMCASGDCGLCCLEFADGEADVFPLLVRCSTHQW